MENVGVGIVGFVIATLPDEPLETEDEEFESVLDVVGVGDGMTGEPSSLHPF